MVGDMTRLWVVLVASGRRGPVIALGRRPPVPSPARLAGSFVSILLSLAVTLTACSTRTSDEGSGLSSSAPTKPKQEESETAAAQPTPPATADLPDELPDSPLFGFLDSLVDIDSPDEELQIYASEAATCMRQAGFDYVEYVPSQLQPVPDSLPESESSLEWASMFGFGISTLAFGEDQLGEDLVGMPPLQFMGDRPPNPNDIYYRSLSPSDQAAFDLAMEGATGGDGCRHAAESAIGQRDDVRQAFFAEFLAETRDIEVRVDNDHRVVTFAETLRTCVRARGHEFTDTQTVFQQFQPRVDAIMVHVPRGPLSDIDEFELDQLTLEERQALWDEEPTGPQALPEEFHAELGQIQREEVELAVAVHECGSLRTLDDLRHVVRNELEEQFMAENEGLLLAFAEALHQDLAGD